MPVKLGNTPNNLTMLSWGGIRYLKGDEIVNRGKREQSLALRTTTSNTHVALT